MKRNNILGLAALLLTGCASENISYVEQDMTVSTAVIANSEKSTTDEETTVPDTEESKNVGDIDNFTWKESFKIDEHKININIRKIANAEEIENATVITAREYTEMTPDEKKNFLTGLFDDGIAYTDSKSKYELKMKLDEAIKEYEQNIGEPNEDELWEIVEDLSVKYYTSADENVLAESYTEDIYYGMINGMQYNVEFKLNSINEVELNDESIIRQVDRSIWVHPSDSVAPSDNVNVNKEQAREIADNIISRISLDEIVPGGTYDGLYSGVEGTIDLYHCQYFQAIEMEDVDMHNFAPITTITDNEGKEVKACRSGEWGIDLIITADGVLRDMYIHYPVEIKEEAKNVIIPTPEYIKDIVKNELTENSSAYIDEQRIDKKAHIDISELKFFYIYIMDEEDNAYFVPCWKIAGVNISPIIVNAIDGNVMKDAWIPYGNLAKVMK